MRRLISIGLSTIGLLTITIAPTLAAMETYSDGSAAISTESNLTDRFDDSFHDGPGGLNSLTDDFEDSFIDGPGGLNS